jgi:diguanylate cyclase
MSPLGAASWDLRIQIILLMIALGGYGLAWIMLERGRRKAAANAHRDAESGAMHAVAFSDELEREVARARRTGEELCLALVEITDPDGDDPERDDLRKIARAWRAELRMTDVLGRVSDRRFGVLLPLCDPAVSHEVVRRLREIAPADVRCAAGVVGWDGSERPELLMLRAEKALAVPKRTGVERTFTPTDDAAPLPA